MVIHKVIHSGIARLVARLTYSESNCGSTATFDRLAYCKVKCQWHRDFQTLSRFIVLSISGIGCTARNPQGAAQLSAIILRAEVGGVGPRFLLRPASFFIRVAGMSVIPWQTSRGPHFGSNLAAPTSSARRAVPVYSNDSDILLYLGVVPLEAEQY